MFFKESEALATKHPELSELISKIDLRLSEFDASAIARTSDFSAFSRETTNRISGLFDEYVTAGVLRKGDMVQCASCGTLTQAKQYHNSASCNEPLGCSHCGDNVSEQEPKFVQVYGLTDAALKRAKHKQVNPKEKTTHLVMLIHGIRTNGEWQDMAAAALNEVPGIKAIPLGFEYLDVLRFWFPFWTRSGPVRELLGNLRLAKSLHPQAEMSVIAHSFGTYSIFKILNDEADLRFKRIIVCGSIVSRKSNWAYVQPRVDEDIINDCGTKDIWPVAARAFSWFYGATGTFGFRSVAIHDRFHDLDHSGFFTEAFIRTFWVPYIAKGVIVPSQWTVNRPTSPWLLSFMASALFRWLLLGSLAMLGFVGWKAITWVMS